MKHGLWFYPTVVLIFGLGLYVMLLSGSKLQSNSSASGQRAEHSTVATSGSQLNIPKNVMGNGGILRENLRNPLSVLFLQLIVILMSAMLISRLSRKIGQPPVIGEMIAGIILGPSLLGTAFPKALSFLFPAPSMESLGLLSQTGVVLFMFMVGMEMNAPQLKEKARAAVVISHASIMAPFLLGVAASLLIYSRFAPPNISFVSFALFMGVAMSVTAFPVLARIIEERGITNSHLGSTAIACAAVDDVTAWCMLTMVIAVVNLKGIGNSVLSISLALAFTGFILFILRPRLKRVFNKNLEFGKNNHGLVVGTLVMALGCAYFTEVIGIHALFGAFLAGIAMSATSGVRQFLKERIGTFSSAALLPLFFAFTGLRTQIALLDDWQSWLACLAIIAMAVVGKLGGSLLAARWAGMSWPDSISIGVLMNTRGLMELVVLNIGYDLGILPGRIFAIMVLMAIVTTCMTGPLLSLIEIMSRKDLKQEPLAKIA